MLAISLSCKLLRETMRMRLIIDAWYWNNGEYKYKSERLQDFIDYRGSCGFSLSETDTFFI